MPPNKKNTKALVNLILLIAKNDGIELSIITKNKRLSYKNVELLNEMGLLDFGHEAESSQKKSNPGILKFKKNSGTFRDIARMLDNKELSKLMKTKYYKDNIKYFYTDLTRSLEAINCSSHPDQDYLAYALSSSPSTVRFFLTDNCGTESLKSIYDNYIRSSKEKMDKSKIAIMDKYAMHLVWENLIFGKIQEDIRNKNLLNPNNYYTGYLPIARKTLQKLLEWRHSENKEEKKSFLNVMKNIFG